VIQILVFLNTTVFYQYAICLLAFKLMCYQYCCLSETLFGVFEAFNRFGNASIDFTLTIFLQSFRLCLALVNKIR